VLLLGVYEIAKKNENLGVADVWVKITSVVRLNN